MCFLPWPIDVKGPDHDDGRPKGAIVHAALQYDKENKGLAVAISPDDAFKYMSFYGPYVKDQGKP